jgi:tRNA 2-thiouridine synthesizing protein B
MLYLIDEPYADVGLRTARDDPEATVVLLQDGVFLDPEVDATVYAVEEDVAVRGVSLPSDVESITYADLVDLIFESQVKTFV